MSDIARTSASPWLARGAAVALSVLASLAAGELLFRILGAPEVGPIRRGRLQVSENPRLLFEPVPGFKASATSDFEEYLGAGNRLGYRDRDHAEATPPGMLRVVVLGDSIAAGYRIERFEDTFPGILGRRLHGAGLPVELFAHAARKGGKERLGLDLFHPSAAGHRCAGEAMARAVEHMIRTPGR